MLYARFPQFSRVITGKPSTSWWKVNPIWIVNSARKKTYLGGAFYLNAFENKRFRELGEWTLNWIHLFIVNFPRDFVKSRGRMGGALVTDQGYEWVSRLCSGVIWVKIFSNNREVSGSEFLVPSVCCVQSVSRLLVIPPRTEVFYFALEVILIQFFRA